MVQSRSSHREEQRLARELRAKLDGHYAQLYCSAPQFLLEAAAASTTIAAPSHAHQMLRAQLGEDEPVLGAGLSAEPRGSSPAPSP